MRDITQARTYIFSSDKATRSQQENQKQYQKAEAILKQYGFTPAKTHGKYNGRTENAFLLSVDSRSEWEIQLLETIIFHKLQQDAIIYQENAGTYVLKQLTYAPEVEAYCFRYTRSTRAKLEDPPATAGTDHTYIPHKGKFLYLEF